MITILNGGKDLQSKVKFSKYYLIFDVKPDDLQSIDIQEVYLKICPLIEKAIGATKAGISAFKRGPDGSYFNACDDINMSFKILEDAISQVGVNTEERKYLKIGVNTDANNWFLEDIQKYEWDGPKVQYDTDQLIEFYEKLIADHPLLEYIEDGFAEVQGYKKFMEKETGVKTSVCHMFESNLDQIKEYTCLVQEESDEEEEKPIEADRQSSIEDGAEGEMNNTQTSGMGKASGK